MSSESPNLHDCFISVIRSDYSVGRNYAYMYESSYTSGSDSDSVMESESMIWREVDDARGKTDQSSSQ